ncbi:MAG TPA: hypothetical protein VFU85_05375 [Nocardioides sp.]|nr:hypothetical protein [Nocardioides sp.]
MSDPGLAALLERAGEGTHVNAPPLGAIAAGARRRRRLRRLALSGVAVVTLAVIVALAAALPGGSGGGVLEPAAHPTAPTQAAPDVPDRGDLPPDAELTDYVSRLEATVVPVLKELKVEYFMDEPDCAGMTYDRPPPRDFTSGDPEHCGGLTNDPKPFDDVVRADHARVSAALKQSGTPIERAGGTFSAGELRGAFFMSTHRAPFATSWELIYDADAQGRTPEGMVTIVAPVPGKPGWWFQCCSD